MTFPGLVVLAIIPCLASIFLIVNELDACPEATIEREKWVDLTEPERSCLQTEGWTSEHWDCGWVEEDFLQWSELSPQRRAAAAARLWTEATWDNSKPCGQDPRVVEVEDFKLTKIKVNIPELQALTMDRLSQMYNETSIRLVNGQASEEAGYQNEVFMAEKSLSDFIVNVKEGDTRHYIHLEEGMKEKEGLHKGVGQKVLRHLKHAIANSLELKEANIWRPEFNVLEEQDYDWAMFIGAKHTNTPMHYDADVFNFLFLVEGKKRIVIIPNDNRTKDMFEVETNQDGGTGWTHENILDPNYPLPDYAVDITLEAGEGIAIPFLAWHAVENLEATLAYSLRILD